MLESLNIFSDNKDCLRGLIFILDGILFLFISWLFTDIFKLENIIFFCHQLIFLINFFFIYDIFFLSCLKGFYFIRDFNWLLILHVTWSRCLMRFKVLVILFFFILICEWFTLEMRTLVIINHISWGTLDLSELILLFLIEIFDFLLLIVFLMHKISFFFFYPCT